jgi:hypothetical protein
MHDQKGVWQPLHLLQKEGHPEDRCQPIDTKLEQHLIIEE